MEKFLKDIFANQSYDENNFFLIAGPCLVESEELINEVADKVAGICKNLGIPYVFKSSYRKANRTSASSFTGIGDETALQAVKKVGEKYKLPTTSDIHAHEEAAIAAKYIDILQIPAFLCRQTDLLEAAALTGKIVNVKKGQFLAPWDAKNIVDKLRAAGCEKILLTERGASFGYNNLVVDLRSFPIMRSFGVPVVFDVTHSLQLPGGLGKATGGQAEYIENFARAGVACGVDAVFMEVHDNPAKAPSDGPNQLPLSRLEKLLVKLKQIHELVNEDN